MDGFKSRQTATLFSAPLQPLPMLGTGRKTGHKNHVPTAEVYRNMRLHKDHEDLQHVIGLPVKEWQDRLVNDMIPKV